MNEIDHATEAAWTALMTKSRVLLEAVESSLKSAGYPPLAWYDALLELEKAGPDGLRPFELKDRILLPQYGTAETQRRRSIGHASLKALKSRSTDAKPVCDFPR